MVFNILMEINVGMCEYSFMFIFIFFYALKGLRRKIPQ